MGIEFKDYKDESRNIWGIEIEEEAELNRDQIKLGCMLRMADSLERIEKPFKELIIKAEYWEDLARSRTERLEKLENSLAGTKAWSTRQKNEIKRLKARIKELEAGNE